MLTHSTHKLIQDIQKDRNKNERERDRDKEGQRKRAREVEFSIAQERARENVLDVEGKTAFCVFKSLNYEEEI